MRSRLKDSASEADDDVLAKYLDGVEITDPELEACLRKGVKESVLAPVLVGSAAKGIGHLAGSAMEAIARQPEAGGRIGTNMIIAAALIEGLTFFALVIGLMLTLKFK